MNKFLKLFAFTVLLLSGSAVTAVSQQTDKQKPDDVARAWVVIDFTFPCPNTKKDRPSGSYKITWKSKKFDGNRTCGTNDKNPKYNAKGFVIQFTGKQSYNFEDLDIKTENGTRSTIYLQTPPAEFSDERYYQRFYLLY